MRYHPIQTFERDGKLIAQIFDQEAGRDLFVHEIGYGPNRHYAYWDRLDRPVGNRWVERLAGEMLLEWKLEAAA